MPLIAQLLCPAFLQPPISRQIIQGKSLNGKIVGYVVTYDHQSRQKCWILDVDQLFSKTQRAGDVLQYVTGCPTLFQRPSKRRP